MRGRTCGLVALTIGLVVPSAAHAVAPSGVSVAFGVPPAATTDAGDETEYTITFTATAGLDSVPGTAVIVRTSPLGPPPPPFASGTVFPLSALHEDEGAFYTVGTADDPGNVVVAEVFHAGDDPMTEPDEGDPGTIVIPTALTGIDADPGEIVTVGIGYLSEHKVQNRPTPCDDCVLAVAIAPPSPTLPSDFGISAPFDIEEGPGDLEIESGNNQATTVGTAFGSVLQAKLVDGLGDPVQGETITFEAPATGPSGTFADGGGLTDDADTDANGIATSSVLTANDQNGVWSVEASSTIVGVAPVEFDLENQVGAPDDVDLVLDPSAIVGNGVSTSDATATVTDGFGNEVQGQTVTFSSTGGQDISATQELGNGQYRATITSTPESGLFTITADVAEGSSPSDIAGLTQTADTTAPQTKISKHPKRKSPRKRAKFIFDSNSGDTDFFECKLDGGGFQNCNSPEAYRVSRGKHTFKVRATDFVGNTGPADKFTFERIKKN